MVLIRFEFMKMITNFNYIICNHEAARQIVERLALCRLKSYWYENARQKGLLLGQMGRLGC